MRESQVLALSCAGLLLFIVSCFLIGFSVRYIHPTEMAILYDNNVVRLGEATPTLYAGEDGDGGRYWVGLGRDFRVFPKTLISVRFAQRDGDDDAITARTSDGLPVTMQLSLQYSLLRDPAALLNLTLTYGDAYRSALMRFVRASVRDVTSDFTVRELWENRTALSAGCFAEIDSAFRRNHARLVAFQLLDLQIPRDVQRAIESTAISGQRIEQALIQIEVNRVLADTIRLTAAQSTLVGLLNADGDANLATLDASAAAQSLALQSKAEADGFNIIKTSLNLSNPELLAVMWLRFLQDNSTQVERLVNVPLSGAAAIN